MENKIMIKSLFGSWNSIGEKDALSFAKWKIKAITMGSSDEERLEMINKRFQGIHFTLSQLT